MKSHPNSKASFINNQDRPIWRWSSKLPKLAAAPNCGVHKCLFVPIELTAIFSIFGNLKDPLKGAVTCAVCPESAWLVTFLIGNVSTGVVTWSALRCGASGESGKKVAAAPLSKTAAAAKTWYAKHPVDYMLHNRFPWKRSGRRSSMWPPYSLRRNLSAAACRPCDQVDCTAQNCVIHAILREFPFLSHNYAGVAQICEMDHKFVGYPTFFTQICAILVELKIEGTPRPYVIELQLPGISPHAFNWLADWLMTSIGGSAILWENPLLKIAPASHREAAILESVSKQSEYSALQGRNRSRSNQDRTLKLMQH